MTKSRLDKLSIYRSRRGQQAAALESVSGYIHRYYSGGEKALAPRHTNDAVENFFCYWHTFRGHIDGKHSHHIREVADSRLSPFPRAASKSQKYNNLKESNFPLPISFRIC